MEKKNTFWTEMARPVVVLVVICLVASALLGFTNAKTAPVIEENIRIEAEKTRKEVIQKLGFVSGRDHDKYEGLHYTIKDGLPVLDEQCSGALICQVVSIADTPTHKVILASVEQAYELKNTVPMTYRYYHEVIKGGAPKNAPSYIEPEAATKQQTSAQRWVCDVCGYVYEGDLTQEPDDYVCPLCGVDKSQFTKE